jgi:hypothetical protein
MLFYFEAISDNKERMLLLKLAKERNMNVQAITLNIVENLNRTSNQTDQTFSMSKSILNVTTNKPNDMTILNIQKSMISQQQLNEEDYSKINAIDWIIYDTAQRLKLLEYANQSMRYFLLDRQNFEATKIVYSKIPNDTLAIILAEYNFNQTSNKSSGSFDLNLQNFVENLPRNVANVIKEYLCFKEYIVS